MKRRMRKRHSKKKKPNLFIEGQEEDDGIPRSFVIHHGEISSNIKNLLNDFKSVMKPNTAEKLKARKRNSIKDFISMSGSLKVTHLIIFTQSENGPLIKMGRLPNGPTLYFRIENYTLLKDLLQNQKNSMLNAKTFRFAPCLMTNLQPTEGEPHMQLCSKLFLDLFPSINPAQIKTNHIRRCCLIHYDEGSGLFDFRHYAIRSRPVGISKATRKMISNKVPNLSKFTEVSDFVVKSEILSDSEGEEDPSAMVNIEKKKKETVIKEKSLLKLYEIGPRLTLQLLKIESGLCEGTVLYHSYVVKTAEEKLEIEKKKKLQERLRKMRQKKQEENIRKKEEAKKDHKRKCLQGMGIDATSSKRPYDPEEDINDDREYYRQEVGEEPDEDLFARKTQDKVRKKVRK